MKRLLLSVCCLTLATSLLATEGASPDPVLAKNDLLRIAANKLPPGDLVTVNSVGRGPWHNDPPCPDLDCSGGGGSGCTIPSGYTAACGFYASTAGGECYCREGDVETTLCMKANAGPTGCGLHESPNDPCCQSGSGF